MNWRPRSQFAAIVALAFVTLAALAPLAAADHAYSHRYVVFGRVVDAENNPVPGLTVDLGYEPPFAPEQGGCANQPGSETQAFGPTRTSPITNQFGEFIFCFHQHAMSRGTPGTGHVRIDSLGVQETIKFDGFMRYSFVPIKLSTVAPNANKTAMADAYTVQGRAWEASKGEIKIESVGVFGDTLHGKDFTITVKFDGEEPQTFEGTTNNYGDFAIRVPVDERPTGGEVTLSIEGHNFTEKVDPALGTTHIRGQVGELRTSNVPGVPLLAGVAVLAVAALALRRR